MNFPYVALLWDPLDGAQRLTADHLLSTFTRSGWGSAIHRPGLTVFIGTPSASYLAAHALRRESGLLLGVLFERSTNRQVTEEELLEVTPPGNSTDAIIRTLTSEYWGGYLALLSEPATGNWAILRDCSGMLPCYYTMVGGVALLTSDARHILTKSNWNHHSGPPLDVRVNFQYLRAFLSHSQLQIRETAICGIHELLAGEVLQSRNHSVSVQFAWTPDTHSHAEPCTSIEAHIDAIHATTRNCIDAWATVHKWVVHNLSGGFDSSLILALLARAKCRPNTVGVNRFSLGPAEDERRYARLIAAEVNIPLIEWPWEFHTQRLTEENLTYPYGAKPSLESFIDPLDSPFFSKLRSAHRFDAIWNGEGGDHLFFALQTPLILQDSLHDRGLTREFIQILYNANKLTGLSIPHLLWKTTRAAISRRRAPGMLTADANPLGPPDSR